jgi:hypothetical protein
MNTVRIVFSLFVLVLVTVAVSGWVWTGSHQPPAQAAASRVVLSLCMLAAVVGLSAMWRRRPR